MIEYRYADRPANIALLHQELQALAIPEYESVARVLRPEPALAVRARAELAPSDIDRVAATVAGHDEGQRTPAQIELDKAIADDAAARALVANLAGAAIGKSVGDLTASDIQALLACVLYRIGAIDRDGIVQPPDSWLQR